MPLSVASQTNPAFFPIMADAEFDSFLTIGMDGPALTPGALSTIGVDFLSWSESAGLRSDNGAVRSFRFSMCVPRPNAYVCVECGLRFARRCFLWIQSTAA